MEYPDIFILAGQSNMSGRGLLSELPIFSNYTKILNYSNAGKWVAAAEPIDRSTGQVDAVSSDPEAAAGPSMAFANSLFNLRPGRSIGLVPCAKGATAMSDWARSTSRSTLYGSMLARANEAAASGAIKGLLFYQGESDTGSTALANAWEAKFLQFVSDVRSDFGSDLKIVFTVLGPNPNDATNFPAWNTLVANQQAMTLPEGVARVSANDLPALGEHLTTWSYITLGERYATAMANLLAA